jgi:hypothetical protein
MDHAQATALGVLLGGYREYLIHDSVLIHNLRSHLRGMQRLENKS